MQQIATKIFEISLKAERMDRFVRLLLQEQAKMEDEIALLQTENAKYLLENKSLKEQSNDLVGEKYEELTAKLVALQAENERLQAENEQLKQIQVTDVATRAIDIEAQDAMKIKIETYIKEIDTCLKFFGE